MKYKIMTKINLWIVRIIYLVVTFCFVGVTFESIFYLKSKYYDHYPFEFQFYFYLSPLMAILLSRTANGEIYYVGKFLLNIYLFFMSVIYINILFVDEQLGIKGWLYILAAAIVIIFNTRRFKRAKFFKYRLQCPICKAELESDEQIYCHKCGIRLDESDNG